MCACESPQNKCHQTLNTLGAKYVPDASQAQRAAEQQKKNEEAGTEKARKKGMRQADREHESSKTDSSRLQGTKQNKPASSARSPTGLTSYIITPWLCPNHTFQQYT